ncbi:MAG: stage II sporulation protein D, partial [Clostridiales bacterium]|nr:stage II sporulation protein D [Clostridiales bacterium]
TVLIDGETETMTLADYLWGVVAAEMPSALQQEALRAQAIAARTYTLYRLANPSASHPEADICGDSGCCQAWMSTEDRIAQWDSGKADAYAAKITQAVSGTDGLALYYEGEPILAAFHAISAGSTKSALEVWGQDIPYLQAVESPEGEDAAPNYYSVVSVDKADFAETFSAEYPEADLSAGDCADWFGEETYDETGLPVSIEISGVEVDTGQVRTLFDLRSATFTVECEGDTVTFYVTGYGHGVGMSQYGANALAKEGKTAEEILAWYYTGAEVKKMSS